MRLSRILTHCWNKVCFSWDAAGHPPFAMINCISVNFHRKGMPIICLCSPGNGLRPRNAQHGGSHHGAGRHRRAAQPQPARLSIEEKISKKGKTKGGKISLADLVVFTRQLATMIDAGIAIVQSLQALGDQAPNKVMRDTDPRYLHAG